MANVAKYAHGSDLTDDLDQSIAAANGRSKNRMNMRRKFALSALVLTMLTATSVEAGVDQWTDLQLPDGAIATALAADPVDDATVYVATAGGVVYKSTDGGSTWSGTDLHQFEDAGDNPPVLSALSIDPNDADVVVAGADYGRIFRSHNAGVTWERDRVGQGSQVIYGLELGFGTDGAAVAATSNGVWFTIALDSGDWDVDTSWTVGGSVPSNCREVNTLAVDRQTPNVQFAGTDCGLFKNTTFNGVGDPLAWQQVPTVPNAPVRGVVFDPFVTDTLYIATDQGIHRLSSGGTTVISNSGPPTQSVTALAIDPLTANLLYVGLSTQGVYKGNGNGAWLSFNPGFTIPDVRALVASWPDPQRLYAMANDGHVYGIRQSQSPVKTIDLTVSYAQSPPASSASGGVFQASATVRNLGPVAAKNIKFVLSLEKIGPFLRTVSANSDVTVTSLQSNRGICDRALATCAVGTLSVGSAATIIFRVQPKSTLAGKRLITVSAASGVDVIWSAGDVDPANNQIKASTSIGK